MFRLLNQLLLLIYFGGNIWNKPFVCLIFAIVNNYPVEYISIQGRCGSLAIRKNGKNQ